MRNRKFASTKVLAVLLTVLSIGIIADGQTAGTAVAQENYKIGPGDVIDVIVSKNDILSRTGVRVNNLGTVQLAMMDADMPAACLTERQLADAVKEKYLKLMVDPYVNVAVREFNSNPVAVLGAVNSPGRFQLQRSIRLVELLTFVNGTSANAGRTVEILRNSRRPRCEGTKFVVPEDGEDELVSVDLSDAFKGGEEANPIIVPGDIVRISDAAQINAYILGNVKSGMAINLKDPVTLTQAIAMAGGTTSGAQLDKVKIRRLIPGTINRDEMIANVKEINQRKRDDILLQPNDIVDVPGPTGAKKFFGDLLKTIVPTITQLPVRVIP